MLQRYRKPNTGFTPDEESFYLTITSDNNPEIFPDNKVSDFQVRLSNSIFLDHDSWKVGLAGFQYPYEFANLTDKSFVAFYCLGNIKTINFPPYFFETIEDLCNFLTEIITHYLKLTLKERETQEKIKDPEVYDTNPSEWLGQKEILQKYYSTYVPSIPDEDSDAMEEGEEEEEINRNDVTKHSNAFFHIKMIPLKRIKMKCNILDFDICFSDNLLQILGLHNTQRFTLENFEYRVKTKDALVRLASSLTKITQKEAYQRLHRVFLD